MALVLRPLAFVRMLVALAPNSALPSRDRQGVPMGLRPTKKDEGARDWCRGINNLDRAFNRAVLAVMALEAILA